MAEGSQSDKLCSASASGNLPEVLFLLRNGADVNGRNIYGRTSLQVVKLSNPAVAEALLKAGANPNMRDPVCNLTVTHDAAREGFVDTVRVLVDHGADVNLLDEYGNLPLHLAAREGCLEVVQLLLGLTADPGRPNGHGQTAWELALNYRRMDTATYIAEYMRLHQ
uniref:cyclin-dependent kinase 4 inhibitor C n=1 Tax=Centroberyx gerrardi TaxID=166262 RepID=UPI003AAEEBE4